MHPTFNSRLRRLLPAGELKRYPGGLALRFARVKGYRPDKRAEEADTVNAVRAIYAEQEARANPQALPMAR